MRSKGIYSLLKSIKEDGLTVTVEVVHSDRGNEKFRQELIEWMGKRLRLLMFILTAINVILFLFFKCHE